MGLIDVRIVHAENSALWIVVVVALGILLAERLRKR